MCDRLSDRIRAAMFRANAASLRLHAPEIRTEHLLLGLLDHPEGAAATVLKNIGVDIRSVTSAIEAAAREDEAAARDIEKKATRTEATTANIGASRADPPGAAKGEPQFSIGAKKALELAVGSARALGMRLIDTEHLLLGLIQESKGLAAKVLADHGVDHDNVVDEIQRLIGTPVIPDQDETPELDRFGKDLTRLAREGRLDPIFGREAEVERLAEILIRRTRRNAILIGEEGV